MTDTYQGYKSVELIVNSERKRFLVHRLVAMAFLPNDENLPCVNHKDCVTSNNFVSNLEWVTHKQNMEHASKMGRMIGAPFKGDKSNARKLREADVIQIKKRIAAGEKIVSIHKDFSEIVCVSAISEIKAGRSWGHVTI